MLEAKADALNSRRRSGGATNRYNESAAGAMRLLRTKHPPMGQFARELGAALGLKSLSRQALYDWENGKTRVPASALLAAADLVGVSLEHILQLAGFDPARQQFLAPKRTSNLIGKVRDA